MSTEDVSWWHKVADERAAEIARLRERVAALEAVDAKVGEVLADQDRDYAQKTNRMIERHADQIAELRQALAEAQNENEALRKELSYRNPTNEMIKVLDARDKLHQQLAEARHPNNWLIFFHDAEVRPELFIGENAEAAARMRFEALNDNWSVHLYRSALATIRRGEEGYEQV